MLNEDRIKLMTEIAIYEKKESRKSLYISRYFRRDYIGFKLIKSAINMTLSFAILAGMWVVYNAQELLETVEVEEFVVIGEKILVLYGASLLVYLCIAYGVYSLRYQHAKRSTKAYQTRLKRLEKRYEFQAKANEMNMTRGDTKS